MGASGDNGEFIVEFRIDLNTSLKDKFHIYKRSFTILFIMKNIMWLHKTILLQGKKRKPIAAIFAVQNYQVASYTADFTNRRRL